MFYRITLLLSVILITWSAAIGGQEKEKSAPPKKFELSEVQQLKLQVKQRDALLAKAAMDSAQANFQQAVLNLTAEADRIKIENSWPKETQFSPNELTFNEPPAPKKDAAKKGEKP